MDLYKQLKPCWHLLAVAMLGRPQKNPPTSFATPLYLDSYVITHPVFEQAQNSSYTQDWPPHHAQSDARALMTGYRAWHEFMGRIWDRLRKRKIKHVKPVAVVATV